MRKVFVLTLLLLLSAVFSGCGQEDCSLRDSTYEKFAWDDDKGECVVLRTIEKDVCGNGVIEEGENYCNCPKDVAKTHPVFGCDGMKGDYLEQSCNSNHECILSQNDKVVEEVKALQFKNGDIIFDGLFEYNKPFILNTIDKNKLKIDITYLKEVSSSKEIRNLVVKEIRIEDGSSSLLGSATYNENLMSPGDKLSQKQIALADTDQYSSQVSVKVKLMVSYTVDSYNTLGEVIKTEDKIETIIGSLGRIDVINPVFYED